MAEVRTGIRIGVDVGRARVGVARSDRDALLATPIETLARDGALEGIAAIVAELGPLEIVVGLPLSLTGADTPSTGDARAFAGELARRVAVPVRLVDERLSTVSAQRELHRSGRSTKASRAVIDQVAAVIILQNALDSERASGRAPGAPVDPDEGS
ncbi:Holliday junction resolvase RuvX [Pseudolysinimonas sp.]|uniref:Holliday junction resolvase RuvX n=1 Tax=Pseudolysinimonas sp. TaxID=2680009 RepID=UPI003F7F6778